MTQTPSPNFLTLPRELRDQIWNSLIPRREVTITHLNTKGPLRKTPAPPGPILKLLLTCSQIRDEVLDTLYSKTTFRFNDFQDLLWLQPPTQFATEFIRSIKLYVHVKEHSNDDFFRDWAKDVLRTSAATFTGLWKLELVLLFDIYVCATFAEEDWHGHGSGRKVGFKNVFLPIKEIQSLSAVKCEVLMDEGCYRNFSDAETFHGLSPNAAKNRYGSFKEWVEKDLAEMLQPPKRNFPRLLGKGKKRKVVSGEGEMDVDGAEENGHGFQDYLENYLKKLALRC
jgi:hypothetical protein